MISLLSTSGFNDVVRELTENWMGFLFQLLVGYIPQGFAAVLFIHLVVRQRVVLKTYVLTSLLMGASIFIIRAMPINFGVHTIINILVLIGIGCGIHKFPLIRTCIASFLVMIFLFLLEGINYAITMAIFGEEYMKHLTAMMDDPLKTAVAWLPPSLEFVVIVVIAYLIFIRRKAKKDAANIQEDRIED